jgi:transposase
MGLRELRGIHNQQDLKAFQSDQLLNLVSEAVVEVDILEKNLQGAVKELEAKLVWATHQIALLNYRIFGKHSEKSTKDEISIDQNSAAPSSGSTSTESTQASQSGRAQKEPAKEKKPKVQRPSERYPNLPVIEEDVTLDPPPCCSNCQQVMKATGLTEESEVLHVIPKQYVIVRKKRAKYGCTSCHESLITAPSPPTILPGSSYSDDLVIDVTLSKYCDLIPVERYAAIAERQKVEGLPPHSLIEGTHHLAKVLEPICKRVREEVLAVAVLAADETRHPMLEGSPKKSWYLWGFSSREATYFEIRSSRSGDVASALLRDSKCAILITDVYSGYIKAIRETNAWRATRGLALIQAAYCNAHARRKFKELDKISQKNKVEEGGEWQEDEDSTFPGDHKYFVSKYREIYKLEEEVRGRSLDEIAEQRKKMVPLFEDMKTKCKELKDQYSNMHHLSKAMNYLMNNYEGLTLCLTDPRIPLDNNQQESNLRNPVVGRKTWYGTHSILGAKTAAAHFTLVESCKLIEVNPRTYYKAVLTDILTGGQGFTPSEWKKRAPPEDKEKDPPDSS